MKTNDANRETKVETTTGYKVAFAMKFVAVGLLLAGSFQLAAAVGISGLILGWLESPKCETV